MTEVTDAPATPAVPNGGQQQPIEKVGDLEKKLTQAEVDAIVKTRLARDREALEKELGMSLKDAKAIAAAKRKADEDAKSELEKITGERDSLKGEATNAKLEAAKLRALAKAGADPEKIEALLKRVVGSTPEEIEADVLELKNLGLLQPKTPNGAQGAGNPGIPPKKQEPDLDQQIADAEKAGNHTLAINLKLRKQGLG